MTSEAEIAVLNCTTVNTGSDNAGPLPPNPRERLETWKQIAAYLARSEKTVRRWEEAEGLPVHRHAHEQRSSVFAWTDELDAWKKTREHSSRPGGSSDLTCAESAAESTRNWRLFVSATLGILLLAGALSLSFTAGSGAAQAVLVPASVTSYPGTEAQASFAPSGRAIAFAWNGPAEDNEDIYITPVSGGEAKRVTTDRRPDVAPAWSPDGASIAFVRVLGAGRGEVLVVPAAGGPERSIGRINLHMRTLSTPWPVGRPAWSRDGRWLLISDSEGEKEPFSLYAVSLSDSTRRRLTKAPQHWAGDLYPALSPDGERMAFARVRTFPSSELYVISLDGGLNTTSEPRQVTDGGLPKSDPVWDRRSRTLLFSAGYPGDRGLWRVSTGGNAAPNRLAIAAEGVYDPALSPVSRQLAFTRSLFDTNVWEMQLNAEGTIARTSAMAASTALDTNAQLSPDGSRFVFVSTRSGSYELWTSDGRDAARLTSFGGPLIGSPKWSPAGDSVAFDARVDGNPDIYSINLRSGSVTRHTTSPAEDVVPSWSLSGEWLYFASNRTGTYQVWRQSVTGDKTEQVTSNGGFAAIESPDGKRLFYTLTRDETSVRELSPRGDHTVLEGLNHWSQFAVNNEGIYFIRADAGGAGSVWFKSFRAKSVRQLGKFDAPMQLGLSVSPDGRRFLYSRIDHRSSDIMLLRNFDW